MFRYSRAPRTLLRNAIPKYLYRKIGNLSIFFRLKRRRFGSMIPGMEKEKLVPDGDRLWKGIEVLSGFRDPSRDGWTRRAFTQEYREARKIVRGWMEEAGLSVRMDAAANLIGDLPGTDPGLAPLLVGSHTDTVLNGGRFDGIAGVLAAVETARVITTAGARPPRTLRIVDFTAEEPTDFGVSTVGSKAMAGNLSPEMLALKDPSGRTLAGAIDEAGGDSARIGEARVAPGGLSGALELHIEQGPVLEKAGMDLGIVTGIVGITRMLAEFTGRADHAGTTPMAVRRDALAAAAEAVLALESLCRNEDGMVGTVGKITVIPNAANVVARTAEANAEIRALDGRRIDDAARRFRERCEEIAAKRDVLPRFQVLSTTRPVIMDAKMRDIVARNCRSAAPACMELSSGAGHDMNQMAYLCPVGMIFIPCRDGRSHTPEEWAEKRHLELGTLALLGSVVDLCGIS